MISIYIITAAGRAATEFTNTEAFETLPIGAPVGDPGNDPVDGTVDVLGTVAVEPADWGAGAGAKMDSRVT